MTPRTGNTRGQLAIGLPTVAPVEHMHTTGGITCIGQSERPKPDPQHSVHVLKVAANLLARARAQ